MVGQNGVQVDYEILDKIESVVSKMAFKDHHKKAKLLLDQRI